MENVWNPIPGFQKFFGMKSKKPKKKKKSKSDETKSDNRFSKFFNTLSGRDKLVNQRVTITEGSTLVNKHPLQVSFGAGKDKEFFENTSKLGLLEKLDAVAAGSAVVETAIKTNTETLTASIGIQRSSFSMWANYIRWLKQIEELRAKDLDADGKDKRNWRIRILSFFSDRFKDLEPKGGGGGLLSSLFGAAASFFRGGALRSLAKLFTGKGLAGLARTAIKKIRGFFSLKGLRSAGSGLSGFFKKIVGGLWKGLKGIFSLNFLKGGASKGGMLKRVGGLIKGFVNGIWGIVTKLFSLKSLKGMGGLGKFLVRGIISILGFVLRTVIKGVAVAVGGVPAAIIATILTALWAIWEYLLPEEFKTKVIDAISKAWDTAIGWLKEGIKYITKAFTYLNNNWESMVNGAWDFAKNIAGFAGYVWDSTKALYNKLVDTVSHIWGFIEYIPTYVGDKIKGVKDKALQVFDGFVSWLGGLWDWVSDLPSKIWSWLKETAKNSPLGKVVSMSMDGWGMIIDKFKSGSSEDPKATPQPLVQNTLEKVVRTELPNTPSYKQQVNQQPQTNTQIRVSERTDEFSGSATMSATPVARTVSGPRTTSVLMPHQAIARSERDSALERIRTVSMQPNVIVEQPKQPPQTPIVIPGNNQSPTMGNTPIIVEDTGLMLINIAGTH